MPSDQALLKAREELIGAGMSPEEAESTIQAALGPPQTLGAEGLKGTLGTAAFLAPFGLGTLGSGIGARIAASPRIAGRIARLPGLIRGAATTATELAQPVGEFAGIAAGDVAARAIEGREQNIKESAGIGAVGAGAGQLFRVGTRVGGFVGNVPEFAIQEAGVPTAGVVPSVQKVLRPAPRGAGQVFAGETAYSKLADKARAAVKKLESKVTPERQRKVALLREADRAGVQIDVEPIVDKILKEAPTFRAEPTTRAFSDHLLAFADGLVDEVAKRGGRLTPSQLDEFIRTNLAPKSFTATGSPAHTRVGPVIREIKQLSTEILNQNLPAEVRELNSRISARLTQVEDAAALFSEEKSGVVNRLRNLYGVGNEENAQALKFLSDEVDKSILREARTIATQTAFAGDPREAGQAAGRFMKVVGAPAEFATQVAAPFQAHVGPAVGGVIASKRAKRKRPKPMETP